jgi:O-antigen ligase
MLGDMKAFAEYPFLGTGYGMALDFHMREFGHAAAAHTEYSRLLAEQGLMGLFFILVSYIILPIRHFRRYRNHQQKAWFLIFFAISFLPCGMLPCDWPCLEWSWAFLIFC